MDKDREINEPRSIEEIIADLEKLAEESPTGFWLVDSEERMKVSKLAKRLIELAYETVLIQKATLPLKNSDLQSVEKLKEELNKIEKEAREHGLRLVDEILAVLPKNPGAKFPFEP